MLLSSHRWYSGTSMAYLAKGIAHASELVKDLNRLAHIAIPGVVKWRYTLENDWSGDPAIFFWVIVTDEASKPQNLSPSEGRLHRRNQ